MRDTLSAQCHSAPPVLLPAQAPSPDSLAGLSTCRRGASGEEQLTHHLVELDCPPGWSAAAAETVASLHIEVRQSKRSWMHRLPLPLVTFVSGRG